jgi:hypothetical protein
MVDDGRLLFSVRMSGEACEPEDPSVQQEGDAGAVHDVHRLIEHSGPCKESRTRESGWNIIIAELHTHLSLIG